MRRQREVTLALKEPQSGQNAKREEAERQRTNVEGLKKKLSKFSERNIDPTVRAENDLGQQLGELFQRGIEEYRDRLLRGVEEAATSLFLKMRSEEDFKGLRINDRYGLAIVDGEGSEVGDRSAGYEHLVALSLIGGLQACSTIAGPVLMDSPFGRLDETHVEQVTSSLSLLSPQVMLLVHEREVDPDEAGNLLGARLLAEYELVRRSSTHTDLRPRRAP